MIAHDCISEKRPAQAEDDAWPVLTPQGLSRLTAALEKAGARRSAALGANALGRLAPTQRGMLVTDLAMRLFFCAVVTVLVGWFMRELLLARGPWLQVSLLVLVLAVPIGATFYQMVPGGLKVVRDLAGGVVRVEEGWVTKCYTISTNGRRVFKTHFLKVNQLRLYVPHAIYKVLPEGRYRLYALPNSALVVNVDPVGIPVE
jgi:hypothetical protein